MVEDSPAIFTPSSGLPRPSLVSIDAAIDEAEKRKPGRPKGTGTGTTTRRTTASSVTEEAIAAGIETLFGALTLLRGSHFALDPNADLSLITAPAKRMLDRLPADTRKKVDTFTDPAMLLFGLLMLAMPGLTFELEGLKRNGNDATANGETVPSLTLSGGIPGKATGTASVYPNGRQQPQTTSFGGNPQR